MLYPLFLILALLIFALVMVVISLRGLARKLIPVVVSPDAARRHIALIYLIRGTGALIAGAAALTIIYFSIQCVIDALHGKMGTLGWPGVLIAIGIVTAILGLIAYVGYRMWLKVNSNVVADFAFLFAVLLSVGWYHLLPASLPKVVIDYCGDNPFVVPFRGPNPNPSYRAVLSYIACYVFYKLCKAYLFRILDLNSSAPAQSPRTGDPSIPEFPQKSPLVQL